MCGNVAGPVKTFTRLLVSAVMPLLCREVPSECVVRRTLYVLHHRRYMPCFCVCVPSSRVGMRLSLIYWTSNTKRANGKYMFYVPRRYVINRA